MSSATFAKHSGCLKDCFNFYAFQFLLLLFKNGPFHYINLLGTLWFQRKLDTRVEKYSTCVVPQWIRSSKWWMNWSAIKDLLLPGGGVTGAARRAGQPSWADQVWTCFNGFDRPWTIEKRCQKAYLVTGKDSTMVSNPQIQSDNWLHV